MASLRHIFSGNFFLRQAQQTPGPTELLPDIMDPRLVQKTVRIFLSSTFTDTRVERNELIEEVFEPIRQLCQQHGIAFEVVDLRWGKTEQHLHIFFYIFCEEK